jgi:hypothetical protein
LINCFRKWFNALFVASLVAATPVMHAQTQLLPTDDAAAQPDFFTFRAHLQSAIARRDTQAVLAVVHKNIKNSFGGNDGIEEFEKTWKLNEPDSPFWNELGTALALGGSFDAEGRFVAPYVFSRWPENVDSFEHVAVIGANVRVRAAPKSDSATLASLSFAIVPLAESRSDDARWTAIRLHNGRNAQTGYISSQFVRSPIDYRAFFARAENRWQLMIFVAGD